MTFGKRLRKSRKDKKLTQTDVANILGIDDTTISKYENDKSEPDNLTTSRLAKLYGVKVSWLLGNEEAEEEIPLSDEENELLESFKKLNDEDQDYIMQMVKRLSKE